MMTSKETDAMWARPARVELGCQTRGQCFCNGRCRRTAEEQAAHEALRARPPTHAGAPDYLGIRGNAGAELMMPQHFEPKPGHGPAPAPAAEPAPAWESPGLEFEPEPASALDTQVGGDHYKKLKIQPMEYSMANGLDACQHSVVRYVTRFRDNGGIQDLEKAKHCIDLLIEFEGRKS